MRIVDVCAFYTPRGGGVKTYIDRKLASAARTGHEIVVIAPGRENMVIERGPGALLVTLASPVFPLDRRYRYFADEAGLHALLDRWRPDFVEASSPWSSASMVARWDGWAPRSLVMHCDPLSAYAYRWFGGIADVATIDRGFDHFWRYLRRLDRQFDAVICASPSLSGRLRAGGVSGATTIEMGVEPGVFAPARRSAALREAMLASCGLGPDATLLLGVGRYSAEKRWGMVIDAVLGAGLQAPVGFVLVGDGRARRSLTARAAGSPHIVVGAPIRDRTKIAAMMASSDALVHGCEAETFCMAAAEARASALPLIVPDRGGASDHADHPLSRRYLSGDSLSLRSAIVGFTEERRRSATVPWTAGPIHTIDRHFDRLFSLYADLADGGTGRAKEIAIAA